GLAASDLRGEFYPLVAARSGVDEKEVRRLFGLIERVRGVDVLADQDLVAINGAIEDFHKRSR
ncbi:MAG: hypothetical protein ABI876_17955, partial [Bacteroidota bacterium]